MALSPFGYIPDLLQALIPNESGLSLFLVLHIPFAAASFALLARELGLTPIATAAGGIIYALGGFSLSTINLYVFAQAIAWAPLFILAFRRAVDLGGPRRVVVAAAALAMTITTTGLEIALQMCLLAVVLSPPNSRPRFLRSTACAMSGLGLAAMTVVPLLSMIADSERGAGFSTSVVLSYSVHPMTFLQVLIADLYGATSNLTGLWWGEAFFQQGFPYVLSLYLGPTVLVLASAGAAVNRPLRRRLVVVVISAAVVALGRYAGWEVLFDISPSLRFLRFPVKAFFTLQFSVALLASFGVEVIVRGATLHLSRLSAASVALGGALFSTMLIPALAPHQTALMLEALLPSSLSSPIQRNQIARFVTEDAATSGMIAVVAGVLCLLARGNRLAPARAAIAVVALLGADLIRAGAGLNPSVTSDFYRLSPEMTREVERIRHSGGRVFSCDIDGSPSYWQARLGRGQHHEAFTMAAMQETLAPAYNVPYGVRSAMSADPTSLVPPSRTLSLELSGCARFDLIAQSLRRAGVAWVLSLDTLTSPGLSLVREIAPARIAPLRIHLYELSDASPRFSLPVKVLRDDPSHLVFETLVDQPVRLTVREPFAKGWRAVVNGLDSPILRTSEGHREVLLSKGHSEVQMSYRPPGVRCGLEITLASVLLCFASLVWRHPLKPTLTRTLPSPVSKR